MRALLVDLARFARSRSTLTVSLLVLSGISVLLLVGVDSETWLLAFMGLGLVYLVLALVDVRDAFRRDTD